MNHRNIYRSQTMLALFLWVGLGCVSSANAQTYKWTDEQGRVHFSDSPPATQNNKVEELDIQVNQLKFDPKVHERRKSQNKLLNLITEERQTKQKAASVKKRKDAKLALQCERLRAKYQRYKHAGAVYRRDKEDPKERVFFNDQERANFLKGIGKKISDNCKG